MGHLMQMRFNLVEQTLFLKPRHNHFAGLEAIHAVQTDDRR